MPAHVWTPSIAACGMTVVKGDAFPNWQGDILAGGLAMETVQRVRIDEQNNVTEIEEIFWGEGRVRDVQTAPDGTIWIALERPGKIVRLVPERANAD
jgi:glucose/arabinose dehydrogenase